jgi:hypothetical protein
MYEIESNGQESVRRERMRRMVRGVGANAVSAAFAAIGYALSANPAYGGEAIHSGGDAAIYGTRLYAEHSGINQQTRHFKNFLRVTMLIPAAVLAYNAWRAGVSLGSGGYARQETSAYDYLGAGVVVAANSFAYQQLHHVSQHSHASHASYVHATADLTTSAAYGVGLFVEAAGVSGAAPVATVLGSTVAAAHLLLEARNPHAEH